MRKDTKRKEEPVIPPPSGRQAGTVIQERGARATGFFGSDRAYDIPGAGAANTLDRGDGRGTKRKAGDVEVAVDVDASDGLSKKEMERLYEEGRRVDKGWKGRAAEDEDFGDMVAEEGRKRLKKDQEDRERRRGGRR